VEPGQCQRPALVSATDETMTLTLNLNAENRGADILEYELSVSTDGLMYTVMTSYDGISPAHTLNKLIDSLVTG
jgi:hypothetical protein